VKRFSELELGLHVQVEVELVAGSAGALGFERLLVTFSRGGFVWLKRERYGELGYKKTVYLSSKRIKYLITQAIRGSFRCIGSR
jgi:hypothetical protein